MPGRTKKVEVAGVQVTARELSVEEIYHWFSKAESRMNSATESKEKPDSVAALLFESVTYDDLEVITDITQTLWKSAYPSEIEVLIEAVKEINPHFFAMRARMSEILQAMFSILPSPAKASEEQSMG